MTTHAELIAALVSAAKSSADKGIASFREADSATEFHNPRDLAAAIEKLSSEEIKDALTSGDTTSRPKFRSLC